MSVLLAAKIEGLSADDCARIQQAGEVRLEGCQDELFDEGESISIAPYCGCNTCQVREVIDAAITELLEIVNERSA